MPLPKWLLADDLDGNQYLIKTTVPRLIGRITPEADCDIEGITFALRSGEVLDQIEWLDDAPDMEHCEAMVTDMNEFLDRYDAQAMNELELDDE